MVLAFYESKFFYIINSLKKITRKRQSLGFFHGIFARFFFFSWNGDSMKNVKIIHLSFKKKKLKNIYYYIPYFDLKKILKRKYILLCRVICIINIINIFNQVQLTQIEFRLRKRKLS